MTKDCKFLVAGEFFKMLFAKFPEGDLVLINFNI